MEKTVFVVGAAASTEFDISEAMPVGSVLAKRIEDLLRKELQARSLTGELGPIASALASSGGVSDEHYSAMSRILFGIHSTDSIDRFVDDCRAEPNVARIAKLCIAHLILEAEKGTLLVGDHLEVAQNLRALRESWLGQILRRANEPLSRQQIGSCLEKVSFVTFNYDRCIERYLRLWIAATCNISVTEAHTIAAGVPVHHVYGSLGNLPLDPNNAGDTVPFGDPRPYYTSRAASRIKTFTEELNSTEHSSILRIMRDAACVVFLGTAFHTQNLQLLFPANGPAEDVSYFGTVVGLRPFALTQLDNYFMHNRADTHWRDQTCGACITEIGDIIFPA